MRVTKRQLRRIIREEVRRVRSRGRRIQEYADPSLEDTSGSGWGLEKVYFDEGERVLVDGVPATISEYVGDGTLISIQLDDPADVDHFPVEHHDIPGHIRLAHEGPGFNGYDGWNADQMESVYDITWSGYMITPPDGGRGDLRHPDQDMSWAN